MSSTSIAFDLFARDRASDKFEKVGKSADGMKGKLGTLAKAGALALGGIALAAGGLAVKFTKMAIEDQAAQAKMAKALQNTTGATNKQIAATEDWITKQGQALGVADDDLRPAISRLAVATGDLSKAQGLASLAMDVSAGTGKSLKTVTEALAKAQNGNLGGLSRLGVATKDAAGNTLSLEEVTKNLAKTYSGQAATAAETTAGKFERLKLRMSEMQESIGAKLIPVADKLAGFMLNNLGPALAKTGAWAKDNLLPPLKQIGEFIADKVIPAARELGEKVLNGLRGFFDKLGGSIGENQGFISALGEAFKKYAEFVVTKVWPAIGWLFEKGLPLLGAAIGGAIGVLKGLTTGFLTFGSVAVKAFGTVLNVALSTFGLILDAAAKGLGWIPGLGDKIEGAAEGFKKFKASVIGEINAVANAMDALNDKINATTRDRTIKIRVNDQTGGKVAVSSNGDDTARGPAKAERGVGGFGAVGASAPGGGALGVVEVVVKNEDGVVIERRLAKLKRHRGGAKLAFES